VPSSRIQPRLAAGRTCSMSVAGESAPPPADDQREAYERDGYLVIDPELPQETLDGAVADITAHFGEPRAIRPVRLAKFMRAKYVYRDRARVQDAWLGSQNVRAIARAPRVLSLLRGLYDRKPRPFQTLNFRVGTEQAPHSDSLHFNSKPPGYMCGIWVALEDIDEENGPLVYYPGSHSLPEVTMQDVGVPAGNENYPHYEDHIRSLIEDEALEPQYGLLKKGQALLWAANLLHGGAPQRDKARTRLSQVTHYFFEGCKYWTPKTSDEQHTQWRHPRWIR
jgi:ectoine hydroxylase-related dioxygenase (phytanoyl-CoA dioxygenase family)